MQPAHHPAWSILAPALAALAALGPSATARGDVEPYYWRQRVFYIPYQPNLQDPQAAKVDKVQLLVARDGSQQWAVLQEANANVRGFSYHAAADGEYDFALRMSDRRGRVWPEQIAQPLLRVVVDTQQPTLELAASLDALGQVVVRYEAGDVKLKDQTLRLEAQLEGGDWQHLALGPPDVNQPDRLLGQLAWKPPLAAGAARFRATIEDAAGNQGTGAAEMSLIGPVLQPADGPHLAPPSIAAPSSNGDAARFAAGTRTAQEWLANSAPTTGRPETIGEPVASVGPFASSAPESGVSAPPFQNAYTQGPASTSSSDEDGLSARFAADAAPSLLSGDAAAQLAPGLSAWESHRPPVDTGATLSAASEPRAAEAPIPSTPWVNSLTFDLDYDIQTAGPWGVAKVELWGTRDGGKNWQSLGVDQDNRSPMRVSVPTSGLYGFRIVVDGGNGVAAPTPHPGDAPEMVVGVDQAAPRAQIGAAEVGKGALAGHLIIRWSAEDENLAPRPVGLFYGAAAEGPWSTIATDLEPTGEYPWRLGRETPPQVFLRLEIRDAAGNLTVEQSPQPIDLQLPRPTGRLRNVRPVESDPDRFRTAAGTHGAAAW